MSSNGWKVHAAIALTGAVILLLPNAVAAQSGSCAALTNLLKSIGLLQVTPSKPPLIEFLPIRDYSFSLLCDHEKTVLFGAWQHETSHLVHPPQDFLRTSERAIDIVAGKFRRDTVENCYDVAKAPLHDFKGNASYDDRVQFGCEGGRAFSFHVRVTRRGSR